MKLLNFPNFKATRNQIMIGICILSAAFVALTSHVYIQNLIMPITEAMKQEVKVPNQEYGMSVMISAFGTSLITVSLLVFLYYYTGHLLRIKNNFLKILVLNVIILEFKGLLIREPFMNYIYNIELGMKNPLLFSVLSQLDKWIPNLLLSICLVYLCPIKTIK